MPACARRFIVCMRRCGVATYGSMARAFSTSQNGMLIGHAARDAYAREPDSTSTSRSISGALVMISTGLWYSAQTSQARARHPVATTRAAGSSRCAREQDPFAAPRSLVERLPEQRGRLSSRRSCVEIGARAKPQVLMGTGARSSCG